MVQRQTLAALVALALGIGGCETPSSRVDGADLRGVFDRDAGAAASAAPTGSAVRTAASSSAAPAAPMPQPRAPEGEGCVAIGGSGRTDLSRTVGRPGCRGADILEWRDPSGAPRYACLYTSSGSREPLPLIVFLHGDGPGLDSPMAVQKQTGLRALGGNLKVGAAAAAGFHVLAVQGRAFAGQNTVGFDAAATGKDNVDLATIDHFVEEIISRKIVDRRRIYAVGLGPGGRMAATWAMLRADKVAAFAAFASPPPTAQWVCPGPPPPGIIAYRACDAVVSCSEIEGWIEAREGARASTASMRLGDDTREVLNCEPKNSCGPKRGAASHVRWPKGLEKRMLEGLGLHALALPATPP